MHRRRTKGSREEERKDIHPKEKFRSQSRAQRKSSVRKKETRGSKIDLPELLDFEAVEKLLEKLGAEKLKKEDKISIVVNAKNVSKVDIVGLQFLISLKKSGARIDGFEDVIRKLPFEIEIT